ncbi:hypothetical protein DACRYDRAFT_104236 [Dacryopinax primogenitus]|uniref:F-box domain-containing protein n=1 Tax=Dacryopinax primogenitus (strain DJM 731) TaxID=1858805 RepID=M5GBI0_DACPD|nr:uncharacterized protein DACRYDRAFT_104236 [Dacryopinax primogenitus]EJU05750.1 hypothetical protein DACRYDRAFT_104236 [Dacryopinax primogenitus]
MVIQYSPEQPKVQGRFSQGFSYLTRRIKGYIRAARLFLRLNKLERTLDMCAMAVERLAVSEKTKRAEVGAIRDEALAAIEERDAGNIASTCHIHRLPYEILSLIFFDAMVDDVSIPITASHVCRRWRETALSNSWLWSTLVLQRRRSELKTAMWMKRSHSRCVDLRIRNDFFLPVDHQEWFKKLVRLVGHNEPARLDLAIGQTLRDMIFDNLPSSIADNLRVLCLHVYLKNPQGKAGFTLPAFTSLRRLELTGYVRIPSELTCRDLEILVIQSIWPCGEPAALFRRLLSDLPKLRVLSLKSPVPASGRDTTPPPEDNEIIALPSLQSVEFIGPGNWLALVKNMDVPALQSLRLDQCVRTRAAELMSTLQPHYSAISELSLCSTSLDEQWLRTHLGMYKNLNRLEISRSAELTNHLVEDLANRSDWPNLQYVNFSHCPLITGSPLLRLVRSHLPPPDDSPDRGDPPDAEGLPNDVRPIKSLIIDGCPKIDHEIAHKLRALVPDFSCVYLTKEASIKRRRADP